MKKIALPILCILLLTSGSLPTDRPKNLLFASHYENILGTSLEMKFVASAEDDAEHAEIITLAEIDRLEKILSSYDPSSEFSKWFSTQGTEEKISSELFEVLSLFDRWKSQTDGALNPAAEITTRLWMKAEQLQQLPSTGDVTEAVFQMNQSHWRLNPATKTAVHLTTVPLALNSFVKSYIIDKACDLALIQSKIEGVLVNIGGDIVIKGNLNDQIRIADPRTGAENGDPIAQLSLENKSIATSGNYRRGFQINNESYSHIIDPRTGYPVDHIMSATIISSSATDAGALATTFNVLTLKEAESLASNFPDVEYLLVTNGGAQFKSSGWNNLTINSSQPIESDQQDWNGFEMGISIEIASQGSTTPEVGYRGGRGGRGGARRPFVAVWIENENRDPVRSVAVWFDRSRWLNELRSWYRIYWSEAQTADAGSSIPSSAGATRPSGEYKLIWNGRNDEGNFVGQGKYYVLIEAAREHGTYQIIRQEIQLDGKPKSIALKGNTEISSGTIDYSKKTNR